MAIRKASERQTTSIRMTSELRAELEASASKAGRSLSQEIEFRLWSSLRDDRLLPLTGNILNELLRVKNMVGLQAVPRRQGVARASAARITGGGSKRLGC